MAGMPAGWKSPPTSQVMGPGAVGRACADQPAAPVITGAGLDPSCAPTAIPCGGSDGEGCWGRGTARTQTDVGVVVVRVVAVPEGGAGVVRVVEPGAAAQQLGDLPTHSS
jgi:hypothetical protein